MSISNYLDSVAKPFEGLAPWILRLVLGFRLFFMVWENFLCLQRRWSPGLKVWE
jgi:hypothetical protein